MATGDHLPGIESDYTTLTPRQVADELGVSLVTLANWRQEPERGPAHLRLGYRTVRYERSAVETFKARRRQR